MTDGWVKFYRQILDNHFLMNDENAYVVFTKLILMADKKGEIAAGRRQLATLMNKNDRTLYGVLIRLEEHGMIVIDSNPRYSVFRIRNWSLYQENANRGGKSNSTAGSTAKKQGSFDMFATGDATTAQPQRNRSATTAQHSNKNKNKKENKNSTNVLVNSEDSDSRKYTSKSFFEELVKLLGFSDSVKATDARIRKMKVRLKTYKPTELLTAAENLGADDFMQGDNDAGKRYGNIDYLLRSDETVDKYLQSSKPKMESKGAF